MVIKGDDIQDMSSVRPPEEPDTSVCWVHLKNVLKKCGIYDMFNYDQIRFLGNVIEQFKIYNSVNYVSFLNNYFEKVSSEDWPYKNEILELLSLHLPKSSETEQRAKKKV